MNIGIGFIIGMTAAGFYGGLIANSVGEAFLIGGVLGLLGSAIDSWWKNR